MLGVPELNTVVQVGSHESQAEGENHLPQPASHACFNAALKLLQLQKIPLLTIWQVFLLQRQDKMFVTL